MDAGHHRDAHFNLTSPARPTRHCCRLNDVWPAFSKTPPARIVVTTAGSLTQAARSAPCCITLTALVSHDTSISTLTPVSADSLACPSKSHSNVLRDPSTISSMYKRFQKHNGIRREVKGDTPILRFLHSNIVCIGARRVHHLDRTLDDGTIAWFWYSWSLHSRPSLVTAQSFSAAVFVWGRGSTITLPPTFLLTLPPVLLVGALPTLRALPGFFSVRIFMCRACDQETVPWKDGEA